MGATNGISVSWLFMESEHGKGPMEGVMASKKLWRTPTAYSPNAVSRKTKQLMNYLAIMQKIIKKYGEGDIGEVKKTLSMRESWFCEIFIKGLGISKEHKNHCNTIDEKKCEWKAPSSDTSSSSTVIFPS